MKLDDLDSLGAHSGDAALNLTTYLLKINTSAPGSVGGLFNHHTTDMHEGSHWARFNGTTIGATLSLMLYAQQRTVETQFGSLPLTEKKALIELRRSGVPIVQLDDPPEDRSEQFQFFRQLWLDLKISYKIFLDSQVQDKISWDREAAIQSALTDCFIFLGQAYSPNYRDQSPAASEETSIRWDGPVALGRFAGHRVTTRTLLECAAVIDQVFSLPFIANPRIVDSLASVIEQLALTMDEPSYGIPLELYSRLLPRFSKEGSWVDNFTTLLVLIDFALNPPLPPAVTSTQVIRSRKWWELYPPHRFYRGCIAARQLGLVSHDASDSELAYYIFQLAREAGTLDPATYIGALTEEGPRNLFLSQTEHGADYIRFLADVQRKFWALRKTRVSAVALFGQNATTRLQSPIDLVTMGGTGWFHPPLVWTTRNTLGYTNPPGMIKGFQIVGSIACHVMLNDAVSRCGPMRTEIFPSERMPQNFWPEVGRAVDSLLNCAIWQN